MPNYCFNKDTGKVHIRDKDRHCLPDVANRVPLGNCPNATSAIQKAKKKHPKASRCRHCP